MIPDTVQLKVNDKNLIESFRHAFTSRKTVITEMVQNARRAGATEVHITFECEDGKANITFEDNGSGIEDFQDLFYLGESGWDEETVHEEKPFGVGFLQAIYQSYVIVVRSRLKYLRARTSDILEQKELSIYDVVNQGTKITLEGVSGFHAIPDLGKILSGFSIPCKVTLGEETYYVERKYSQESLSQNPQFIETETEIGTFFIDYDRLLKEDRHILGRSIYYQGLSAGEDLHPNPVIIFHANNDLGQLRMPDRDVFVDNNDVLKRVSEVSRRLVGEYLRKVADEDYIKSLELSTLKEYRVLDLANHVKEIPTHWLKVFDDKNLNNGDNLDPYDSFYRTPDEDFEVSHLGKKLVIKFEGNDDYEYFEREPSLNDHGYRYWTIVYLLEKSGVDYVLIENDQFQKDHWIYEEAIDIDSIEYDIETSDSRPEEVYWNAGFTFCRSFRIKSKVGDFNLDTGDIDDGFCLSRIVSDDEYSDTVLYTDKCEDTDAVVHTHSFVEDERYYEDREDAARDSFYDWVINTKYKGHPDKIIESHLNKIIDIIPDGCSFTVTKNETFSATLNSDSPKEIS